MIQQTPNNDNLRGGRIILALGLFSAAIYAYLALHGALREALPELWLSVGLLAVWMILAVRLVKRESRLLRWALLAAVLFRLIVVVSAPTLSDDIYRYVWDGRVQLHGVHPFEFPPDAPELTELRDDNWERINHREVPTIYPPFAQLLFAALSGMGAGVYGFKAAMAIADMLVVVLLVGLLRRRGLGEHRALWYAWNPLAVLESAGSGHLEAVGVLWLILAVTALHGKRLALSGAALATAIQTKLVPLIALPALLRRFRIPGAIGLLLTLALLTLPYAMRGPAFAAGTSDYAERWERNASVYRVVESTLEAADTGERLKPLIAAGQRSFGDLGGLWNTLYHWVWPRELARLFVMALAALWLLWLLRSKERSLEATLLLSLGGVLLLVPTLHPWYLLWLLPWAAFRASPFWLALSVTIFLSYVNPGGDVPLLWRLIEYGLPVIVFFVARAKLRP